MNDDSSKRDRGGDDGVKSDRQRALDDVAARANDADEILRLFNARMGIADSSSPARSISQLAGATRAQNQTNSAPVRNVHVAAHVLEMTPTPMVVGLASDAQSSVISGTYQSRPNGTDERQIGDSAEWREADAGQLPMNYAEFAQTGRDEASDAAAYAAYHGPRTPPSSIAPPPAEASFSVASEYDPKAPTKPKLRRNTSVPPAPLLFGMDRMLVWGLVLGGTFVAAIVVIVHQLTSLDTQMRDRGAASPPAQPVRDFTGPVGPLPSTRSLESIAQAPPIGSQGHPPEAPRPTTTGSLADPIPPQHSSARKSSPKPQTRRSTANEQGKRDLWIE